MKKFKIIIFACLFAAILGCDKNDANVNNIYDVENGQSLVAFDRATSNLPVLIDDSGTVEVKINVSTVSAAARTVVVTVDDELSTANPENYSIVNPSVTIPAGSFQGVLTINGVDTSLETVINKIVLNISSFSVAGSVIENPVHTVNIFQVCPVSAEYLVGNYSIQQLTDNNPDDGVPVFNTQIVNITNTGGTSRSFSAVYLEGLDIGQAATNVTFNLVCNEIIVDSGISTALLCVQGSPPITLGPALVASSYDDTDDSVVELTLTEYETDGGCDVSAYQVTFRLTKQ